MPALTVVQKGTFAPFNAEATLFLQGSLWALWLPTTVHGRVSDIWRGYVAMRLLHEFVDQVLAFSRPLVVQERNAHNYLADFASEQPLYLQSGALLRHLSRWRPRPTGCRDLPSCLLEVMIGLYERAYVDLVDVENTVHWIGFLRTVGYAFPGQKEPLLPRRLAMCVSGQVRTLNTKWDQPSFPAEWPPMRVPGHFPSPKDLVRATGGTVASTVQKYVFEELKKHGFQVDVFMYVTTKEGDGEPKVNDTSVCEPLRPTNGYLGCAVVPEVPFSKQAIEHSVWKSYVMGDPIHIEQLLQQLDGERACNAMLKAHEKQAGVAYDFVVRHRPDQAAMTKFPNPHLLDFGTNEHPVVRIASKEACCCGNEDTFGISTVEVMDAYLDRVKGLFTTPWNVPGQTFNSEDLITAYMRRTLNATLQPESSIEMCIVKPTTRTVPGDPRGR